MATFQRLFWKLTAVLATVLFFVGTAFSQEPKKPFPTGAKPTPAAKILSTPRYAMRATALEKVAYIPAKLDPWGNNQYGVCVSSEEAFSQGASGTFIESSIVIAWARKNGWLNGAYLTEVMDEMQTSGFVQGGKTYGIGNYAVVDYSRESELQNALSIAPVKIAMASSALPSGAGSVNGWYALGGRHRNTDHCVALCGYGPAGWLCEKLKVQLPSALKTDQKMYLLFTWGTIGLVDHAWIMGTCVEAWVRNPSTTIDGKPQPNPGPVTPPDPPGPGPNPVPPGPGGNVWVIDQDNREITIPSGWKVKGGTVADSIDLTNISAKNAAILKLLADSMREKPPKTTPKKAAPKGAPKASIDPGPLPLHFAFADLSVPIVAVKPDAPDTVPEPPVPYTPPDPPKEPVRVRSDQSPAEINATYAAAVKAGEFLVWLDEVPIRDFDKYNWSNAMNHTTVTISGPHNGRHVEFIRLRQATVSEIQTALAKAKAWTDSERQVSLNASPK